MTGLYQFIGAGARVGENTDGGGAVIGADSGRYTLGGVYGNGEVCFLGFSVYRYHAVYAEMAQLIVYQRHANEASPMKQHLVHAMGSHFGRGHHKVALVFSRGIVSHHHHFALRYVGDGFLDCIEHVLGGFTHCVKFYSGLV